ncbi:MAG: Hsp20/alpha crystallin family protein [Polyangiaceae bacterium]|nr:Hsp20/alpha crystallin family protein [Polyangiaceae bacterium]
MLELWNPLDRLSFWSDFGDGWARAPVERFAPAVDVVERPDSFEITAELPGLKPEDVEVKLENGVLTLSGKRNYEAKDEQEGYRRVERHYGSFTRCFSLPKDVRGDDITADLRDGVLTVKVPKDARALPRKIEVRASAALPEQNVKSAA